MREFFLNKYTPRGGSTIERQMALLPRLVGPNLHVIENSSDWLLEQIPNPLIFRSPNFSSPSAISDTKSQYFLKDHEFRSRLIYALWIYLYICLFFFLNSEDYYDSDATQFSDSDRDIEGNFEVLDVDHELLDKWIPPLFYLARGISVN
jgi:hypothetical protein